MPSNQPEPIDLFEFANKIDAVKQDLLVELFLFNKNFTPYATRVSHEVQKQLMTMFVYQIITETQKSAATGITVRDLDYESDAPAIIRTDLSKVGRAETVVHLIENERDDLVYFSEEEHEFKRMKGMVARVTHKTDKKLKFYVIKMIEQSKAVVSGMKWQFGNDQFDVLEPDVAFRVPEDVQTLIVGGDIFMFNQTKFEKTFNFDYARYKQSDQKVEEFNKRFKISVPSGIDGIQNFLHESRPLLDKFLKANLDMITQDKIIEVADEMQIELMTDDEGAIILMEKQDLAVMLDIISDNYFESPTGNHYIAKSKKPIEVAGE